MEETKYAELKTFVQMLLQMHVHVHDQEMYFKAV